MPLRIAPARDDELPALAGLLIAQLREHDNPLSDTALTAAAAGLLARPQWGRFLLAWDGEQAVGFAALSYLWTLEHGGRAAWLDELYVVPARRGAGIGAQLVAAALAHAASVGATAVDLEIDGAHERAAALYRRAGFTPLPRRRWTRTLTPAPATRRAVVATPLAGGCCCGAVRYEIALAPRRVSHCHCGLCRRSSGAPVVTWLAVPVPAFVLRQGTPRARRSSPNAVRTFCADCGTALTFQADGQDEIDVTVASLDHPGAVEPDEHIWCESRLDWLRLEDDLPRHPRAATRLAPTSGGSEDAGGSGAA